MRGNARLSVSDIRRYYFVLLHAQLKEFGIFAINCFKVNALFSYFWSLNIFFFFFKLSINFTRKSTMLNFLWALFISFSTTVFWRRLALSERFFLITRFYFLFYLSDCQHFIAFIVSVFIGHSVCFFTILAFWVEGGWESAIKKAAAFSRGK